VNDISSVGIIEGHEPRPLCHGFVCSLELRGRDTLQVSPPHYGGPVLGIGHREHVCDSVAADDGFSGAPTSPGDGRAQALLHVEQVRGPVRC
jgi:hypothetical protein